ncbi:MAG: ROK family protein [Bacteroidaceae bacterium]|nr:ROK family protein [Bacteroidaceae bacterium]
MMESYVIGIDLGGTNTVIGLVDAKGTILGKDDSVKTQAYREIEDYTDAVAAVIKKLAEENGCVGKIEGVGIGAPMANYYTGEIVNAANLPWKGIVPLGWLIEKKTGLPTKVTNDANAAAIGEMKYGVAQGMKDFIVITLGTGVGSGVVANGQLIYGHDGFAGELGHVTAPVIEGRTCGCGRTDCLETYASATGIVRTAKIWLGTRSDESVLRNVPCDQLTSKMLYDAAMAGDALANEIFEFTGGVLGDAFCNFIAFSAPEAIVLFGGLANAGELLLEPIRKRMNENVVFLWKDKVKVLKSSLPGADAAVLGASALGWK